jgi:hypothetical protein
MDYPPYVLCRSTGRKGKKIEPSAGLLIPRIDNAPAALGERATEGKLSDRNEIERMAGARLLIKGSPTSLG